MTLCQQSNKQLEAVLQLHQRGSNHPGQISLAGPSDRDTGGFSAGGTWVPYTASYVT
jgi:hypothetical protein